MKNYQIRPLGGLYFALLFVFNIALVTIAVFENNDIYVAYAILISSLQFYVYEKWKLSRFLFAAEVQTVEHTEVFTHTDEGGIKQYDSNLN